MLKVIISFILIEIVIYTEVSSIKMHLSSVFSWMCC